MTVKHLSAVVCTALALAGTGCASTSLRVQKVSGPKTPEQGVRYSLPKPFLVMKPSPSGDGTFTVELVYLPNEEQTYAISGRTKRGKYSLEVETKEGLLKKVTWNAEGTTQLGADSIKTASELAKAVVDKHEADQKEAETEREAEQKAAKAEVKAAEDAVDAKTLALQLAELELTSANSAVKVLGSPTADEAEAIRQAQLKRDKANAELTAAQAALAKKQAALAASNIPLGGGPQATGKAELFWGPVIYEIRDRGTSVDLVPVQWKETSAGATVSSAPQKQLETVTLTPPTKGEGTVATTVGANPVKAATAVRRGAGAVVTITVEKPVKSIDFAQVLLQLDGGNIAGGALQGRLETGGTQIVLTYSALAAGTYSVAIQGFNADSSVFQPRGLKVTVP